jgi:KaiC/GvpD/RAD55 family RecA-like ATPase/tetratricopeptide (TPR) repeat protein
VGRQKELEELAVFLSSAVEGRGKTVFISGEAGAGKTRLVNEFLNEAKTQGVTVLVGWCLSNAAVPFFPFYEAFNAYFSGEHEGPRISKLEISNLFTGYSEGEKSRRPPAVSAQVWKDQTFVAVSETLSSISEKKPVILFVDDVQWADSASLALIHYIARAMSSEKVLLLATFRSEQLFPDAEGRPHPLVETLRLMRRENLAEEIKLTNLTPSTVLELAKGLLGGDVQQDLGHKLAEKSQGNPLFVVEALRMLNECNGVVQDANEWRLSKEEIGIPAKIKDIILQRLDALSSRQREALDAASVIGEKFDISLLASVLGQDSLETSKILDSIRKNTSLVFFEEEMCRFDHSRSREAVYGQIPSILKRGYHAKIAEKLEGNVRSGKLPFNELAYHYDQAGNEERAVTYAMAAGKDALARWSNEEAIKHFNYVVQKTAKLEKADDMCAALEGLGDALLANSMLKYSSKTFEKLATVTENSIVRLRAFRKAMECAFQLGDSSYLMELVKKAEPYAQADRLEYARILIARGRAFHLRAMLMDAAKDMDSALPVLEEEYSLWDIALILIGLGGYHGILGKLKEGMAESVRSIALFDELGDFRSQMEACWVTNFNFSTNWLLPETEKLLSGIIEIDNKTKMGDYLHLLYAYGFLSRISRRTGNFKAALDFDLKGLELIEKTDAPVPRGVIFCNLVILYVLLGDLKLAEHYLKKLSMLPDEVLNHPVVSGQFARAVFFAAKGEFERAYGFFNDYFELGKAAGIAPADNPTTGDFPGFELYAWILQKQGRLEEAKAIVESAEKDGKQKEARFEHADLQAHMMVRKQVAAGDEFEMRFDLANIGRKPLQMEKIVNVSLRDFEIISPPIACDVGNEVIEMKNKEIGAFHLNTMKIGLKALKTGTFTFNPQAVYLDDLRQTKTCALNTVRIIVSQATPKTLPGRVSSGTAELDNLLQGGIPKNYNIILTASPSNERELLIKRFLETPAQAGQTTMLLTTELGTAKDFAEAFTNNFTLFLCGPQAELIAGNLPNVHKFKGVDNLNEIDIALTRYLRTFEPLKQGNRVACIQLVSDVLLQHHGVITRKWLSDVLMTLKSKGFTTIAVVNPQMHPREEVEAILSLFDGEIALAEKDTDNGVKKVLKVKRLSGQEYLDTELEVTKEKLGALKEKKT